MFLFIHFGQYLMPLWVFWNCEIERSFRCKMINWLKYMVDLKKQSQKWAMLPHFCSKNPKSLWDHRYTLNWELVVLLCTTHTVTWVSDRKYCKARGVNIKGAAIMAKTLEYIPIIVLTLVECVHPTIQAKIKLNFTWAWHTKVNPTSFPVIFGDSPPPRPPL